MAAPLRNTIPPFSTWHERLEKWTMPPTDPDTITLSADDEQSINTVRNFFLAYFYDMTQYDPNLIINAHGLPVWNGFAGYEEVETPSQCVQFNWWIRGKCELLLIRVAGHPAGFAIVLSDPAHLPADTDVELMDFYITPKYRRQGVGKIAARKIFDRQRGRWILFELAKNRPALDFWHGFLETYTEGNFQNLDNGTQQRFDNRNF